MNSVECIKALRLSDEEIRDTHGSSDGTWASHDWNIADAQYDKLFRGLIEILRNNPDEDGQGDFERQEAYRHFASMLHEVLGETAKAEPSD